MTVTFTEAVSGFGAGDVSVTNGAAGAPVEEGDASTYTVAITPDGAGDLEIGIAADVATDTADNGNTAAASVRVAYDATCAGCGDFRCASDGEQPGPVRCDGDIH